MRGLFLLVFLSSLLIPCFAAAVSNRDFPDFDFKHPPQPGPDCIPGEDVNTWYCHGLPKTKKVDTAEQEALDFIYSHHPEMKLDKDGRRLPLAKLPTKHLNEYTKSKDPDAIFDIDGIPVEELGHILDRHLKELSRIEGFIGSGIDKDGIFIEYSNKRGIFPNVLEGAKVHLKKTQERLSLGATLTQTQRPVRGATEWGWYSTLSSGCTLTGSVLARGMPWLLFPAHCLNFPDTNSIAPQSYPHYSGIPLAGIPRYTGAPSSSRWIAQPVGVPPGPNSYPRIGFATVWDPPRAHMTAATASDDLAAAALDNNTVERDNSLGTTSIPGIYQGAPEALEVDGMLPTGSDIAFNLAPIRGVREPYLNELVTVYTSDKGNTGAYTIEATIIGVHHTYCNLSVDQAGPYTHCVRLNFQLVTRGRRFTIGDSGSPVLSAAYNILPGYFAGMLNWTLLSSDPGLDRIYGGGAPYGVISDGLKLDDDCGNLIPGAICQTPSLVHAPGSGSVVPILDVRLEIPAWSQQVGQAACTWAYIHNAGTVAAAKVKVANNTSGAPLPIDYYNPAGNWNIPYDIGANVTVPYALCANSLSAKPMINYILDYYGTNAIAPTIQAGRNTLALGWSNLATASIAMQVAEPATDTVHIPGPLGAGYFVVSANNLGNADDFVTLTVDTDWGYGGLPITGLICELNGANFCIAPFDSTWSGYIPRNQQPVKRFYIGLLAQGAPVTWDKYYNRVFIRARRGLKNITGPLVGSTGLAVTTQ